MTLDPTLETNLRALAGRDTDLVHRLVWPVASDHVQLEPRKAPVYLHHDRALALEVTDAGLRALDAQLSGSPDEVFVFGLGLGEITAHLLARGERTRVVAWDRDPWLMRQALSRHDFIEPLATGRLELLLGVDLALERDRIAPMPRLLHPTLATIYRDEHLLLTSPRGSDPRWAALGMGRLFVDDMAEALRAEGYQVVPIELLRWSREELEHALTRLAPEVVAAINYHDGLAEFCEAQGRTLVVWEIDPTTARAPSLQVPTRSTHVFTYRRAHVDVFRRAGFTSVEQLPLATNPTRRSPVALDPPQRARWGARTCFVGSSMTDQAARLRADFLELYTAWHGGGHAASAEGEERIERILRAQAADRAEYRVPELAQAEFGPFLQAAAARGTPEDPVIWLAEIAAAEKRLDYVAALGGVGVRVWGDEGWRAIEAEGVEYAGRAGHLGELTCIYSNGAVHVDVNRLYQPDIVTMRVFDVLACGGFLLAEHSEELGELFRVGEELESFNTREELVEKAVWFVEHPDAAAAIGERGRAAVLERHTIPQRVRHMLARSGAGVL